MIRILSIKKFRPLIHTNRIYDYSFELTELASKFPGFISSENFWKYNIDNNQNDTDKMFTISKWHSIKSWEYWKKSNERSEFHKKCEKDIYIGDIVEEAKFYCLTDRESINNFKVF